MVSQLHKFCGKWMITSLLMTELAIAIHKKNCPPWHTYSKDGESCECCKSVANIIWCEKEYVNITYSHCLNWNNDSSDEDISRCLYTHKDTNVCKNYIWYSISIETTGQELNNLTCRPYNRHGPKCQHCIDGYGPAAYSDSVTCADCSKHKYSWILNLLFQLTMVTLLYLVIILFQIKGTCSPFNIIITNCQLGLNAVTIGSGFRPRLVCVTNQSFTKVVLTLLGLMNLDFFRFVIPPLCISPSLKSIHVLLFDYIIAVYPITATIVIYVAIELYDRNCRIIVLLSTPLRLLWCRNWQPKETILSTCATFLLLSYNKFLLVSISLIFNVQMYACSGEAIPNSSVLLYDPSINFLSSEHIPYAILALTIIIVFVLLPPLLLLLYPTRLFKKCLNCCGFHRWDILHLVMDVFQGWYKDGTEGTFDYRYLSALYMILRTAFSFAYFEMLVSRHYIQFQVLVGLLYAFLGMTTLALQPYKVNWMNQADGTIFLLLAFFALTYYSTIKVIYYIGIAAGSSAAVVVSACLGRKCFRRLYCNANTQGV